MRPDRHPALHHVQVAIPAGGEGAARRFHGELFGLEEIEKPASLRARGGTWFATGTLPLHLGVDPAFSPATKAHVAFEVADLAAARERCEAAGHPSREDEPLPGYARCYVDDPFGNRVELLAPVEAAVTMVNDLLNVAGTGDLDPSGDSRALRDVNLG